MHHAVDDKILLQSLFQTRCVAKIDLLIYRIPAQSNQLLHESLVVGAAPDEDEASLVVPGDVLGKDPTDTAVRADDHVSAAGLETGFTIANLRQRRRL